MRDLEHVVMVAAGSESNPRLNIVQRCEICGAEQELPTGEWMSMEAFALRVDGFISEHRECAIIDLVGSLGETIEMI